MSFGKGRELQNLEGDVPPILCSEKTAGKNTVGRRNCGGGGLRPKEKRGNYHRDPKSVFWLECIGGGSPTCPEYEGRHEGGQF